MKITLEDNDLKQIITKINPNISIEDWTEEGIVINSNLEVFKGKFVLNLKLDNISRKAEVELKVKDIKF
jgi:hypothetical protein